MTTFSDMLDEITFDASKQYILDICSGTCSSARMIEIYGLETDLNVIAIDIDHTKTPNLSFIIPITYNINDITSDDLILLNNKCNILYCWISPPCEGFTNNMNDKNEKRDLIKAYGTLYSAFNLCQMLVIIDSNILCIIENPQSPFIKQFCIDNDLIFRIVSYCKYSQEFDPFLIRKNTYLILIAKNIKNIAINDNYFLRCKKDCNSIINGNHIVTLGYHNNNFGCMTGQQYFQKLKQNGQIPSNYNSTDMMHYVPVKIHFNIVNMAIDMKLGM